MGLIASGRDDFWRAYWTTPRVDRSGYIDAPVFARSYGPRFVSSMSDGTTPDDYTGHHRLFDCPKPVKYSDGSDAYCACEPPPPDPNGQLYYDRLRAAGVATWHEVIQSIIARFPPSVLEPTSPVLERVAFDELANYSPRLITRCEGEATWNRPHPIVETTLDPLLFPTEPASDDAIDVTDILNTAWIMLLSKIGQMRGVIAPACFEGAR
jgi:hypothetical protein